MDENRNAEYPSDFIGTIHHTWVITPCSYTFSYGHFFGSVYVSGDYQISNA